MAMMHVGLWVSGCLMLFYVDEINFIIRILSLLISQSKHICIAPCV